jgi:hypothetical protein
MTEENGNFLTDLVKSIKVPADLTKATLEPSAKQIGEGLGTLFYLAFSPIEKARIKKEYEIKKFKEEIESEINKIPVEQIIEPPLNVVGPALEASKYYIEHEDIRSMFSKLIASSMNESESKKVHTSFVEIIKQLSPLDAKVFKFLNLNEHIGAGRLRLNYKSKQGGVDILTFFFPFPEMNKSNFKLYSASINNLIRLGLINVDFGSSYVDKERYEILKTHNLFKSSKVDDEERVLHIEEFVWNITDFGSNFSQCCL